MRRANCLFDSALARSFMRFHLGNAVCAAEILGGSRPQKPLFQKISFAYLPASARPSAAVNPYLF